MLQRFEGRGLACVLYPPLTEAEQDDLLSEWLKVRREVNSGRSRRRGGFLAARFKFVLHLSQKWFAKLGF